MPWWIWLIIALILGIIEVVTTTFVLMWIAIGGAVTAILTFFAPNLWFQVTVFAIVSAVLLIITRPMVRRWRSGSGQTIPAPSERMVGKTGVVITAPTLDQLGTVRVHGELWSASSMEPLGVGMEILVVKAESSVLLVRPHQSNVVESIRKSE